MYRIRVSSHTDIGDKKETNQDSILTKCDVINGHHVGMFIVADGCGGLSYGDQISHLIISYFSRVWSNELKEILKDKRISSQKVNDILEKAICDINIGAKSFGEQVGSKVGSTLSLLLTIDNRYYIKNVGDSRVYLFRKRKLKKLTEDQSLVAEKVRNGELTEEEAKNFKKKNVLTMCIGVFDTIYTYSTSGTIKNNDIFLICCDGFHNQIDNQKIVDVIRDKRMEFEKKCEFLRLSIPDGQATDNVSSIIVHIKKSDNKGILIAVISLVLIALLCFMLRHPLLHLLDRQLSKLVNDAQISCSICGKTFGSGLISCFNEERKCG